jgi:hypothetical protein
MTTQLTLPQNGLKVGNQIVAEGDNVSLGTNVGVKGDLKVGGSIFTNRITTSYVTKVQGTYDTLVIDCNYPQHNITLASNFPTITFTNVPDKSAGAFTVTVYLQQDVLGNRAIGAWPSNLTWPNSGPMGNTLGLLTNYGTLDPRYPILQNLPFKLDVFQFTTFDGGNYWYATQINPTQVQQSDLLPLQTKTKNTIVQVVNGVKKDTWSVAPVNGSTFYPVTGLTATITPKYQTSSILVCASIYWTTGYYAGEGRLLRNGSNLTDSFGTQRGSRPPCTFVCNTYSGSAGGWNWYTPSVSYLDTTLRTDASSVTYGIALSAYSTYSIGVNYNVYDDNDSSDYMGCPISTITLYEVTTI